jgi:hypothetical protein
MDNLYQFIGLDKRVGLFSVTYLGDNNPGVELVYNVPEANKKKDNHIVDGIIFIREYIANTPTFEYSNFKEVFEINGILWGYYKDKANQDFVLQGKKNNMHFEITTQGDFSIEKLKDLLVNFKHVN